MRTFLIGLDGATYTILDHLVAEGVMPNLARVYREGARSELTSTPVPITPQAWTTLATGRNAGQHGFHDFVRFKPGPHGLFLHINNSRDIHCESLWQCASRMGRRVTVLNWIGLAPPQPLNGHSMPGFTSGRHLRRSSWPADLFDRLRQVDGLDVNLLGMDLEIERQALQAMPREQWLEWIHHQVARDRVWQRLFIHLAEHEPSDLTAMVIDGVDKVQHLAYRYLDPAMTPRTPDAWERQVIDACRAYFRQVDEFLGRVLTLAGDSARVFVASDHGFTASTEIFYVNRWLHEQGWLRWKGAVAEDVRQVQYTERLGDDANAIDISASRAYTLAPSSNGIHVNVPPHEYDAFRDELIARLLAIRAPDGGAVIRAARKREDCLSGPLLDRNPDVLLRLRDYGFVSVLNARQWLVPRSEPLGTHHPQGVLLGVGPGIRRGARSENRDILDVAPLLAYSVGLGIPQEYEGRVPAEFFEPAWLAENPPVVAAAATAAACGAAVQQPRDSDDDLDDEERAIMLDRLRSLGYMESAGET
ncbi:MAG: alkaline phosphatase family protein [Phycisphaerae bacterium]|jgi:predicted AlkP superfamily phosphohydrolase/phosphomutase